jgi:phospholipase/carboxylesterase
LGKAANAQIPTQLKLPAVGLLSWCRHGAGQGADEMFDYLGTAPEEAGVAVLAPNSCDNTWDAIGGSFGPDVKFVNRALELGFERLGNAGKCWRLMSAG